MGIADRMTFSKVNLPPIERYLLFQFSNPEFNLSITRSQSILVVLQKCRGRPRYVIGSVAMSQPKMTHHLLRSESFVPIPVIEDL